MNSLRRIGREDHGATLVEWGLLVTLIAIIAILAVTSVGEQNSQMFSEIGSAFP